MSQISDDQIEQLKLYFHELTKNHFLSIFGEEKGKVFFEKYKEAFQIFFEKSLKLMPTNLSKRHGINAIFVLAFDKALEEEDLAHEEIKKHILTIYKVMTKEIFDAQVKQMEESENPWETFVENSKKGNALLYENEFFEGIVAFDLESVFGIDIQKCLYYEIFLKNLRLDLGPILCAYDYLLAKVVDKWIRFERTSTIVDGWSRCDFRYYPRDYSSKSELSIDREKITAIMLDFIHKETGWGDPLKSQCEFEDFYLRGIKKLENENLLILIEYHFDEDGFSMYPRVHILKGEVEIDKEYNIVSFKLEETYTGPASVEDPYVTKKE